MKMVFFLVVELLAGCAVGMQPSATISTAMPAAEHWFRVSWTTEPERNAAPRLTGYVSNEYGSPMARIQLLAQAFDAQNAVVGQKLRWIPGAMEPFSRSYFEVRGLPAADHYKVSVWAFDVMQSGCGAC